MADKKLRIKIIPDVTELKKSLSKLAIGGRAAGGAGSDKENKQVKEEGVKRSKDSSKILLSLKNIIKFVSISAFVAALFAGLIRIMEPFFKLISVILTLLFLPLIPLLKPVLLILAEMAKAIASSAGGFLTGEISLAEFIAEVGTALVTGIAKIIPIFLEVAILIFNAVVEILPTLLPLIVDALLEVIESLTGFAEQLGEVLVKLVEAIPSEQLVEAFVGVIIALIPFLEVLIEAFVKVIEAMIPLIPKLVPPLARAFIAVILALIPLIPTIALALFDVLVVLVKTLFGVIIDVIKASTFGFFKDRGSTVSVTDAIIRPNGQIIRTNPADTLIATKNPESLLGGGGFSTFAPNITIQATINNDTDIRVLAEKIAEFSKDELSRRTTLFNF